MSKSDEIIVGTDKKNNAKQTHGCCGGSENQKHDESSTNPNTKYQCPMKCEGDKTYKVSGNCPVCNMNLKPVK